MYKCLLILIALTSGSLCQEKVNLTDTYLSIANDYANKNPVGSEKQGRQGSSGPSVLNMHGYYNYHADQQVFFVNGFPQNLGKGGAKGGCLSFLERDDYVVTPGVGAHKMHSRKVDWNSARKSCMEEGGHLVIVNSDREEQLLLNLMIKEKLSPIWVGLHDQFEEGDWITLAGDPMDSTGFTKWSTVWPNQPDNYGGRQNCGILIREGGIDDIECDITHSYVCEIELC